MSQSPRIRPMLQNLFQRKSTVDLPLLSSIFAALLATATGVQAQDHGQMDSVMNALSHRCSTHGTPSVESLEQLAGGEDELVALLLEYRTKEQPPFVGIRAQKILLHYAGRSDVAEALSSDVESTTYLGLARVVGVNIDSVEDSSVRRELAARLIARGKREKDFASYAKSLSQSNDAEVSRLARQAFE